MSPSSPRTPTRALPDKPNLNQLKKQAKDLLKAFQAGEPTAIDEVRAHYPHPISRPQGHVLQLSDAQLVLARAYGFDSWPKLKAFVDGVTMSRFVAAVETGDVGGVRAMLHRRPELVHMDTAGNNEHRGLHYAVLGRNVAMVRLLMQAPPTPARASSRTAMRPPRSPWRMTAIIRTSSRSSRKRSNTAASR